MQAGEGIERRHADPPSIVVAKTREGGEGLSLRQESGREAPHRREERGTLRFRLEDVPLR